MTLLLTDTLSSAFFAKIHSPVLFTKILFQVLYQSQLISQSVRKKILSAVLINISRCQHRRGNFPGCILCPDDQKLCIHTYYTVLICVTLDCNVSRLAPPCVGDLLQRNISFKSLRNFCPLMQYRKKLIPLLVKYSRLLTW